MAALSSFIVTRNDRYAHDCRDRAAVTRWRRPWIRVPQWNSVALCGFCGRTVWQQTISTKKYCPCTVNIACRVKQSVIWFTSSRKGEQLSKTNIESVGRWRLPRRQRILRRRFPGTWETVGQVFKFVWRFVCFQSRFVTYLLTFLV
jgi:hypothetical protein